MMMIYFSVRLAEPRASVSVGRLGGWWVVAKLHGQRIILGVMRLAFPLLFPILFPFPSPFPHSQSQQRGTRMSWGFGFPKNPTNWSPIQEAYRPPTLLIPALTDLLRPFFGPLGPTLVFCNLSMHPPLNGWQPYHP